MIRAKVLALAFFVTLGNSVSWEIVVKSLKVEIIYKLRKFQKKVYIQFLVEMD